MKLEAIRFDLPCSEKHRGRKPCEWRIGDFVIPKALICTSCNDPKTTNKDAFVTLCEKHEKGPQELFDTYVCRSCRSAIKKGIDPASLRAPFDGLEEKPDNEYEDEPADDPNDYFVSTIKNVSKNAASVVTDKVAGVKTLGVVIMGEPIRFRVLAETMYDGSIMPTACLKMADEVHDLTLRICIKHKSAEGVFDGNQFLNAPVYDSTDMWEVCNKIVEKSS